MISKSDMVDIIYFHFNNFVTESQLSEYNKSQFRLVVTKERISRHLKTKRENKATYILDKDYEDEIFASIFKIDPKINLPLYHYTSLSTAFSIMSNNEIYLSSIAGMNDRSEQTYVDELMGKPVINKISLSKIAMLNRRFIISFSEKEDNLNQWRLYGEQAKGCCIQFQKKNIPLTKYYWVLGKVLYGDDLLRSINALNEEIKKSTTVLEFRRLYLWKNFIKSKDYEYECEIRLLLFNYKDEDIPLDEIHFRVKKDSILVPYVNFSLGENFLPLTLTGVQLGGNVPDAEINKAQFEYLVHRSRYSPHLSNVKISISKIRHFRI